MTKIYDRLSVGRRYRHARIGASYGVQFQTKVSSEIIAITYQPASIDTYTNNTTSSLANSCATLDQRSLDAPGPVAELGACPISQGENIWATRLYLVWDDMMTAVACC